MAISSFSCAFCPGDSATYMAGTDTAKAVTVNSVKLYSSNGDIYGYWCSYKDDFGVLHPVFAWPDELSVPS